MRDRIALIIVARKGPDQPGMLYAVFCVSLAALLPQTSAVLLQTACVNASLPLPGRF